MHSLFYMTKVLYDESRGEIELMTQDEVRALFIERIESGVKQTYIARNIGVPKQVLSAFKLNKKNLYPESLARLEAFLTSSK